jgi:hypothetical protein
MLRINIGGVCVGDFERLDVIVTKIFSLDEM